MDVKKLTYKELREKSIEIGLSLEANDYNRKFENYPGQEDLTTEALDKDADALHVVAGKLIAELYERKIDVDSDEELEYACQFM